MGDEVTRKDLQSLQGYVNKKIAEVETRLKKSEDGVGVLKDVPTKQDMAIMETYSKWCESLDRKLAALADRVAKLEKR